MSIKGELLEALGRFQEAEDTLRLALAAHYARGVNAHRRAKFERDYAIALRLLGRADEAEQHEAKSRAILADASQTGQSNQQASQAAGPMLELKQIGRTGMRLTPDKAAEKTEQGMNQAIAPTGIEIK